MNKRRTIPFLGFLLIIGILIFPSITRAENESTPNQCTYSTWEWNTKTRRSQGHRTVRKNYSDLTKEEKDPHSNCTVCNEDQVKIELEGVPSFSFCKHYEQQVRQVMKEIISDGFPVNTVSAHRVGRSKGPIDEKGLRTQFSNHSFGTAIDINAEINGLYTNCFSFNEKCRLLRGGEWQPENPGTVTKDSVVYKSFKYAGWNWGGELKGRQKDFMHFSLSGD